MSKNSDDITNHDDEIWLELIRSGDEHAFEDLFKKYYLSLTRFAWRYVDSRAIAEELVQELFTILWEKKESWETNGSVRSYLYKSVRNLSLNHLKHQSVKQKFDQQWMEQKKNPQIVYRDEYREQQIREAITKAIDELPERSKMTYKLHRYDGLTYAEIADVMEVSVKTVESQMVMEVSVKTVESQMTRTLQILREKLAWLLPFLIMMLKIG